MFKGSFFITLGALALGVCAAGCSKDTYGGASGTASVPGVRMANSACDLGFLEEYDGVEDAFSLGGTVQSRAQACRRLLEYHPQLSCFDDRFGRRLVRSTDDHRGKCETLLRTVRRAGGDWRIDTDGQLPRCGGDFVRAVDRLQRAANWVSSTPADLRARADYRLQCREFAWRFGDVICARPSELGPARVSGPELKQMCAAEIGFVN